jgi:tRNA-specific 2-thiouridylase
VLRVDDAEVEIALDEPVAAITPGQSLVLYEGDRVVGGGVIERLGMGRDARADRRALPVVTPLAVATS